MSTPQDQDDSDGDSIAGDLKKLNEMDIDRDFNAWSEFRSSFAVRGGRQSLASLVSRSSLKSSTSTTPVVLGKQNKFDASEHSIAESDLEESVGKNRRDHGSLDVSFSSLTPAEKRELRTWNTRLTRDVVFSRYYFPQQWELREMDTLKKFLEIENPRDDPLSGGIGQGVTKKTIGDLFYPGDHDPKSVLLKRGPVLCDGVKESEMLLFTHGFLLASIELDTLINTLFAINSENPELLSGSNLKNRFNEIDTDQSGSLDRCELKELFKRMDVLIGEQALSDIMERFDVDSDGTISFPEFESVMHELGPKPKESRNTWGFLGDAGQGLTNLGQRLKKSLTTEDTIPADGLAAEGKVEYAFPLSGIDFIESINICSSEPTQMFAKSSWSDVMFALFLKGRAEPLLMVCSKPEQRLAWMDAFRICYVKSIQLSADSGSSAAKKIRSQVGWQHRAIRASVFSLVVCNDLKGLEEMISTPSPDDIDDQDEYCGYTALHYAAALGHLACAKLLLGNGANANLRDDDGKTPLDIATLAQNCDAIQLLQHHGAKTHASEPLFKSEVEEANRAKASHTPKGRGTETTARAKEATGAMSQAMSALRERGERLEKLENQTTQLQNDAEGYAEMARKMKEKNRKKANFFGM
ncbi:hypothetical protein ACHAWF_006043 [Thalassiosira exigua]